MQIQKWCHAAQFNNCIITKSARLKSTIPFKVIQYTHYGLPPLHCIKMEPGYAVF